VITKYHRTQKYCSPTPTRSTTTHRAVLARGALNRPSIPGSGHDEAPARSWYLKMLEVGGVAARMKTG
jgi:hypothetical protein